MVSVSDCWGNEDIVVAPRFNSGHLHRPARGRRLKQIVSGSGGVEHNPTCSLQGPGGLARPGEMADCSRPPSQQSEWHAEHADAWPLKKVHTGTGILSAVPRGQKARWTVSKSKKKVTVNFPKVKWFFNIGAKNINTTACCASEKIPVDQQFLKKPICHQQWRSPRSESLRCLQHTLPSSWCSLWRHLNPIYMSECIALLPCDWLVSNLFERLIWYKGRVAFFKSGWRRSKKKKISFGFFLNFFFGGGGQLSHQLMALWSADQDLLTVSRAPQSTGQKANLYPIPRFYDHKYRYQCCVKIQEVFFWLVVLKSLSGMLKFNYLLNRHNLESREKNRFWCLDLAHFPHFGKNNKRFGMFSSAHMPCLF